MRRGSAILAGVALLLLWSRAPTLHVHAYSGHDHGDHHHGPASHEHDGVQAHGPHDEARWDSCDPGQHTIPFTFLSTEAAPVPLVAVVSVGIGAAVPELRVLHIVRYDDPRAHGPPCFHPASPRAPPATPA